MSIAEQLRAELVDVLADARGATDATSAARIAVTEHRGRHGRRPVVAEEVYRALADPGPARRGAPRHRPAGPTRPTGS